MENIIEQVKYCPKCKQILDLSNFHLSKGKPQSYCKPCRLLYKKEHYNSERAVEKSRQWARNNSEQYKKNQALYRNTHREELNLQAREYRKQNNSVIKEKDKVRNETAERKIWRQQYFKNRYNNDPLFKTKFKNTCLKASKKYYKANPNKSLEYYYTNRDNILKKRKIDYYQNYEEYREYFNKYSRNHPEFGTARRHNRRFRESVASGFFNTKDIREKLELQNNKCIYCSKDMIKRHLDHMIPLAKGGTNWPDNLAMSCASCNQYKGSKLLYVEWMPSNPLPVLNDYLKQLLVFP